MDKEIWDIEALRRNVIQRQRELYIYAIQNKFIDSDITFEQFIK